MLNFSSPSHYPQAVLFKLEAMTLIFFKGHSSGYSNICLGSVPVQLL